MGEGGRALIAIAASVVGLATISVILSAQAQTSSVISAGGQAFSSILTAATAPVTGGGATALGGAAGAAAGGVLGGILPEFGL